MLGFFNEILVFILFIALLVLIFSRLFHSKTEVNKVRTLQKPALSTSFIMSTFCLFALCVAQPRPLSNTHTGLQLFVHP